MQFTKLMDANKQNLIPSFCKMTVWDL